MESATRVRTIFETMTVEMDGTRLKDQILGGILGLAVADALGVPVEFQSRESLRRNPVTEMRGHGTYNQPPGTWSDDTSLTLCLLDSLANKKIDYADIMQKFQSWSDKGEYTAHGKVFDIGIATRRALQRFRNGTEPLQCGGTSEQDNGNGSLMRILPIAFYLHTFYGEDFTNDDEAVGIIHHVSSLTHAHKRSLIACGVYLIIAKTLLGKSADLKNAILSSLEKAKEFYESKNDYAGELKHYKRIFKDDFAKLPEEEIRSSGYVVDTLEAALWCLLNTDNYKDCVLKAVNLGEDTDTVAAIAGSLAGMFYGVAAIPKEWLHKLARRDYIEELCVDFHRALVNLPECFRNG
jgi:ADP-ribosylglycohydrolase